MNTSRETRRDEIFASLLFSSHVACEINEEIQRSIAPYLIIFFNYNPLPAESDEGMVYMGINNLYKLMIDGSVLGYFINQPFWDTKNLSKEEAVEWKDRKQVFSDIKNRINTLRTALDHNECNLSYNSFDLEIYNQWLNPENNKKIAFEMAVERLYEDAKTIQTIINDHIYFVNKIKKTGRLKEDGIKNWSNEITKYYAGNMGCFIPMGIISQRLKLKDNNKGAYQSEVKKIIKSFYNNQTKDSYKTAYEKSIKPYAFLVEQFDQIRDSYDLTDEEKRDIIQVIRIVKEYKEIAMLSPINSDTLICWENSYKDVRGVRENMLKNITRSDAGNGADADNPEELVKLRQGGLKADKAFEIYVYEIKKRIDQILEIEDIHTYEEKREKRDKCLRSVFPSVVLEKIFGETEIKRVFPEKIILPLLPNGMIEKLIYMDMEMDELTV